MREAVGVPFHLTGEFDDRRQRSVPHLDGFEVKQCEFLRAQVDDARLAHLFVVVLVVLVLRLRAAAGQRSAHQTGLLGRVEAPAARQQADDQADDQKGDRFVRHRICSNRSRRATAARPLGRCARSPAQTPAKRRR